jgi:hypothetical protein
MEARRCILEHISADGAVDLDLARLVVDQAQPDGLVGLLGRVRCAGLALGPRFIAEDVDGLGWGLLFFL